MTTAHDSATTKKHRSSLTEFFRHDWEQTRQDLADFRQHWAELRARQRGELHHLPRPDGFRDYKPEKGPPPEERHGWSLNDPHSGTGHGHREN